MSVPERKISQLAGKVLAGRYELVKVIGDGGMGRVYRGVQLSTGGRVAIKIMDAWDHDAATVKRFRYEAETTASLSHPNTVRILDFGSDDDLFFLVMEYLPGTDLTRYLRREGQSDPFVAHVLLQTACSLAEAHSRGVVHRDIKPNNIMLLHHAGLPSFVKVIDFGIARAIGGPGNGTVGVLGTMGYIAPEQMKDGVQLDARTDLYSLGCVAYELLSGRLPFDGITHNSPPMDVLEAHLRGNPTPLYKAKPGVNPRLSELIMSLIRKRPDDRPPAAGELIEPLYALRRELSPELAYTQEQSAATSASQQAAELDEDDEGDDGDIEVPPRSPAGTAAFGLMDFDHHDDEEPPPPPLDDEPPPRKVEHSELPFNDEDDEDVISSVKPDVPSKPPAALAPAPEPEGEAEATAGKTVRISRPPDEGPPVVDPPFGGAEQVSGEWGFQDDAPPATAPVGTPRPASGGRGLGLVAIGVAVGAAAMWVIQALV
ncbi:MAG: serine/threonine protein kinase [Myxococcales bacterium]|nr:serine/threonine protein kinase [Myxococcales bacterium]